MGCICLIELRNEVMNSVSGGGELVSMPTDAVTIYTLPSCGEPHEASPLDFELTLAVIAGLSL